jgi:hypothetical protein
MSKFNPLNHPICFSHPLRTAPSTWAQHVPFAMFLVDILRPKLIVELGTYYGVSYSAFCQAIKELELDARCYGVDTWQGDSQSGYFGSEVLSNLKEQHDPLYGSFSRLLQSTFTEASVHFRDNTIDLLHIDGFHTYEAVSQDFAEWLPKMSDRGVILFHDINVREKDFGVWKFWDELKVKYPYFEMMHGYGLGLLAVGQQYPESLQFLLDAAESELIQIREFFYQLGSRVEAAQEVQTLKQLNKELHERIQALSISERQLQQLQQMRSVRFLHVWLDRGFWGVAGRSLGKFRQKIAPSPRSGI